LPADHAYPLFAGLCRILPVLHETQEVGILPVNGLLVGDRRIRVVPSSRLVIRAPEAMVPELLNLAGQVLHVGGSSLVIGPPRVEPLKPRAVLWSRLVTIKGYTDPERFLAAATRQLEALGVRGRPALLPRQRPAPFEGRVGGRGPWVRRTVRVGDRTIVGYAVFVDGLSAEDSLLLQERGLGGRRHLGCGIFVPLPRRWR
jgi:CRISPR-associated protein Cas6